ncbi:phage antirepressor KilAC domain-containing protein [Glycomyces tenuis]|uniref:phage antirepressor KilAC domain-containing protein n=1 Tax=Glycomyces tenuis TaxID=58116 RepID=UPI00042034D0|nr:phage antirepressor KilAC domain-containing protein [Glycomyces tenuis]
MNHTIVSREEPYHGDNSSPFDQVKHTDEHGNENWTGRSLQPLMEYSRWEDFATVIEKAKDSLRLVEGPEQADRHFGKCRSDGGRWGNQQIDDYRLTRFAAYLTAMAGDDTKRAVAEARIYFAVKTREAEVRTNLTEIEVARRYLAALESKQQLEAQVAVLEPKAAVADQFLGSEDTIYLNDLAKNLKLTRHRLITILRDEAVLYADELQYRAGFEDWFCVEWDWVSTIGQHKKALKVTRKGVRAIYELLVEGEWISPDRRRPTHGPPDNRP